MDEGVAIQNMGPNLLNLSGWQMSDGEGAFTFPEIVLPPGAIAWCARQATAFRQHWGFLPACEYESDSDPATPNAVGIVPRLGNTGDEVLLLTATDYLFDAVYFGADAGETPGWEGPRLSYYQSATAFPARARFSTGCLTPPHPSL